MCLFERKYECIFLFLSVSELEFWRNYFSHVKLVRSHHAHAHLASAHAQHTLHVPDPLSTALTHSPAQTVLQAHSTSLIGQLTGNGQRFLVPVNANLASNIQSELNLSVAEFQALPPSERFAKASLMLGPSRNVSPAAALAPRDTGFAPAAPISDVPCARLGSLDLFSRSNSSTPTPAPTPGGSQPSPTFTTTNTTATPKTAINTTNNRPWNTLAQSPLLSRSLQGIGSRLVPVMIPARSRSVLPDPDPATDGKERLPKMVLRWGVLGAGQPARYTYTFTYARPPARPPCFSGLPPFLPLPSAVDLSLSAASSSLLSGVGAHALAPALASCEASRVTGVWSRSGARGAALARAVCGASASGSSGSTPPRVPRVASTPGELVRAAEVATPLIVSLPLDPLIAQIDQYLDIHPRFSKIFAMIIMSGAGSGRVRWTAYSCARRRAHTRSYCSSPWMLASHA